MTARSNDERSGQRVILRRDHIAGGVFIAAGLLLFALSGDLPFGTLASPGAGMMPKLVLGLLLAFGAILVVRAGESPPLAEIPWNDFTHAATVVAVAAVAIALYTVIGFVLSVSLLLFVLLYFIERRNIWRALAVSISVTVSSYLLFSTLLKSPLPPMPLYWF
jgi:tripartite tricarboxylate transporter TctB family protein